MGNGSGKTSFGDGKQCKIRMLALLAGGGNYGNDKQKYAHGAANQKA